MFTLSFSYWKPGRSLARQVFRIEVPSDVDVYRFRETIAPMIHIDDTSILDLYKVPENNPLPLNHLKITEISFSDLGEPLSIILPLASVFASQPAVGNLHLVVVNTDIPSVLNCWIRGRNPDIPIELEMPVIDLLRAIQEKTKHLDGVLLERLNLYKSRTLDYLEGDHLGHEGSQELRKEMARQLKQLVKDFHLAGYVHGDLRPPNIYRVKDKIMLLDFDWADQVGKAVYPYQTLNPVLREGRDMDNLMITVDDDERILKITLESIGCS